MSRAYSGGNDGGTGGYVLLRNVPQIEPGWNETPYHHARDYVPGNPKETWDFGPLLEFFGG